jgi:ribosomal protein S18 acetylase RimI-like enzyme
VTLNEGNAFILSEYSQPKLITAIHDSWNQCAALLGKTSFDEYYDSPRFCLMNSNLKIALFNRILKTNLSTEEIDQKIQETIDYFESKSLPFYWQVDPQSRPKDLADRLEKAGLERRESPGMAIEIENLVVPQEPEGFRYERATSPEKIEEYAKLLVKAYGMPEFGWDFLTGCINNIGVVEDFQHYIGYLDDKPVGTSSVLYGVGVAGLYNVSTLPEARGNRVGSIMFAVPYADAADRGYKIGILHSSPMGYNMYRRLGFQEICKLIRYRWNPLSVD